MTATDLTWHVAYQLADGVPRVAHVQAPQACDARRAVLRIARKSGQLVATVGVATIGGREPAEGESVYVPGYRFRVSARYEDGEIARLPQLFEQRASERGDAEPIAELEDGEAVEVVASHSGAVVVRVPRTGAVGFLG